jgi:hypothetical protein
MPQLRSMLLRIFLEAKAKAKWYLVALNAGHEIQRIYKFWISDARVTWWKPFSGKNFREKSNYINNRSLNHTHKKYRFHAEIFSKADILIQFTGRASGEQSLGTSFLARGSTYPATRFEGRKCSMVMNVLHKVANWLCFSDKMTDILVGAGSLLAGVLYPSYMSFKALSSPDKEDDTQVGSALGSTLIFDSMGFQ